MSKAEKVARKAIRAAHSVINVAVLVVIMVLICFGSYALWDSDQVHRAAAADNYAIYKPVPIAKSFDELILINNDVFAWIEVYGTHIDYPVVQGKDNMHYVNTNAEGKYSLSGAIFLDYHCARDFTSFPSILYGHHMEKSAMFGEVGSFSNKTFFDERRYGMLFFNGREHGLEFFAFLHVDAYDKIIFQTCLATDGQKQAYLDNIAANSIHSRDIGISVNDNIVLLTTCSNSTTNGRDVLVARVGDVLFDNPYATEDVSIIEEIVPGGWLDYFLNLPLFLKLVIFLLPLIALLLLISFLVRKSRRAAARKDAVAPAKQDTEIAGEIEGAYPSSMDTADKSQDLPHPVGMGLSAVSIDDAALLSSIESADKLQDLPHPVGMGLSADSIDEEAARLRSSIESVDKLQDLPHPVGMDLSADSIDDGTRDGEMTGEDGSCVTELR